MVERQSFLKSAEVHVVGTVDGVRHAVDVMGNWGTNTRWT